MVGTYLELQNRVQTRVIDLPAAVLAEIPQLVNEAHFELMSRHNFKCMEKMLFAYTLFNTRQLQSGTAVSFQPPLFVWPDTTTPANTLTLQMGLPSTSGTAFKEFRAGARCTFVRYQDGSLRFISIAPNQDAIYGTFTEGDNGFPATITTDSPPDGQNLVTFKIYPLPDGLSDWPDGEYRLQIPYYAFLPQLVNNGDNDWLTVQPHGERFILEWATAEAFALDWDVQNEQKWRAKAEVSLKRVMDADKRFRLGELNELAIHSRGVYAGRTNN